MTQQYFLNFPSISYNGFAATNIMDRVIFAQKFKNDYRLFYEFTVPDGKKAETIAHDLYGSADYVWMIYLFNDIVDPYYQWPLADNQFNQLILDKYGSYPLAAEKVHHYENNWYSATDDKVDIAGYTALPANLRKYWRPSILPGNKINYYKRAPLDTQVTTNQLLTVTTNNTYAVGNIVAQNSASGEVTYFNAGTMVLKNTNGAFVVDSTITSIGLAQFVIPADEIPYYVAVSMVDWERQINDNKARIKLLKPSFLPAIEQSFKNAFTS